LWEKIFTFFLVNDQPEAYVKFYLHCIEEIEKIREKIPNTKVSANDVSRTLLEFLDSSHEIALSLNPNFISEAQKAARHFEFQINRIESNIFGMWLGFKPTKPDSFWGRRFRMANMIRHHYVIHPLLNFTMEAKKSNLNLTTLRVEFDKYKLDNYLIEHSPRPVKFWECCLSIGFKEIFQTGKKDKDENVLGLKVIKEKVQNDESENTPKIEKYAFYLDEAFELFKKINQEHVPGYSFNDEKFRDKFYTRKVDPVDYDKIKPTKVQEIVVGNISRLPNPNISFANTEVLEKNIIDNIRENPNLGVERYQKLSGILKKAREENSNILLFPEFFIPINLLSSIARFAERNQMLTVTGLEHVTVKKKSFNFIITILPFEYDGIKDATVVFRLKNHYAHIEESLIDGNHLKVPKPNPYRYDIFNWRNIYFSSFYCFELANALHRSLMKGKIDLLIGIEWNKDTPYFSNIVESCTRDLHTYIAQVNTSQFGDTRLSQPVETARKDILRLKGGINDAILVAKIDIDKLREFQREKFSITHEKAEFKPLPPDFSLQDVLCRIKNQSVI